MTTMLDTLAARSRSAQERAIDAQLRAVRLLTTSVVLRTEAARVRTVARSTRTRCTPRAWFFVKGDVDGEVVSAAWRDGQLWCDPMLRVRAELVVALGDTFTMPERPGVLYTASLEGPVGAVLLTVVRALSHVRAIEVGI